VEKERAGKKEGECSLSDLNLSAISATFTLFIFADITVIIIVRTIMIRMVHKWLCYSMCVLVNRTISAGVICGCWKVVSENAISRTSRTMFAGTIIVLRTISRSGTY